MNKDRNFNPPGRGFSVGLGDTEKNLRYGKWKNLTPDNGCAFDFIASSAILEWLGTNHALDIDPTDDGRFRRYRRFAALCNASRLISHLVLFERIYLNVGTFYLQNIDMSQLNKYGFFMQYPRPIDRQFLDAYRLIKPLALKGLNRFLASIVNVPFNDLWTKEGRDAQNAFRTYAGLIDWLYDECAKDACGLDSQDLAMSSRIKGEYVYNILDFMEYAVHAQGSMAVGSVPLVSSIMHHSTGEEAGTESMPSSIIRDNVFALYQLASSDVLGHMVSLRTFNDVLRLREDKRVLRIRKLLGQYHQAISYTDKQVIEEITAEIQNAKKALDVFQFTENPVYTYVVKIASYLPVAGTIVSLVNDSIDLAKAWDKRKNGWIYFGLS